MSFHTGAQENSFDHNKAQLRGCFTPCRSLERGEISFPLTRVDPLFEEQSVSGFFTSSRPYFSTPSQWIEKAIVTLATIADAEKSSDRPIHLPTPLSLLLDENAPFKAEQACMSAGYCTQEFMLEFKDSSLVQAGINAADGLDAFRRLGFRIALDARTSFETALSERLRPAVERLRVNCNDLKYDETIQMRAEIVSLLDGDVIVDRALWRDVDELKSFGATHAEHLISDA